MDMYLGRLMKFKYELHEIVYSIGGKSDIGMMSWSKNGPQNKISFMDGLLANQW